MIKKTLPLIFVFVLFLASNLKAQSLFVGSDTAFLDPGNNDYINAYIPIQNQSGNPLDIEWNVIENTLNPDWMLQFCDFEFCYTNDFEPLKTNSSGTLVDDYDDDWYLGVALAGNPADSAMWVVEITNLTDGVKDTMVWVVTDRDPVSVNQKTKHSINISLYPNPASNLIQVSNPENRSLQYRVLDVSGKELTSGRVSRDQEPVNVEALSSGLYFF